MNKRKIKKITSSALAIFVILSMIIGVLSIGGCGTTQLEKEMLDAMNNEQEIKISVTSDKSMAERNPVDWIELDQLESFKEIRKIWDDELQIVKFDMGSKNGCIFVDLKGNWAGNNTLYNAFQNKYFVTQVWDINSTKSALAQAGMTQFSDIDNEGTGIIASLNAYFNILPTDSNGESGLFEPLSRAEAMAGISRADTPVILTQEENEFTKVVGNNDYNIYAQNVLENSYLDYKNESLNYDTYNSLMSRAEVCYILAHRYFENDLESVNVKDSPFGDCKNAGNIAEDKNFKDKHAWQSYELDYSLQNSKDGAPEEIYKAMLVCYNRGILNSDSRWNEPISAGELITMLISAYTAINVRDDFLVNAKIGENAGNSLVVAEEPEKEEEPVEVELGSTTIEHIKDVTNLDDLIGVYGDELQLSDAELQEARDSALGFTFEPCDKWMQVDFCSFLNVRVGPSTDFRIIKSVPVGTKVHIVARCIENGWYRVIADGKIAYQCGVYFSDFEGADEMLKSTE